MVKLRDLSDYPKLGLRIWNPNSKEFYIGTITGIRQLPQDLRLTVTWDDNKGFNKFFFFDSEENVYEVLNHPDSTSDSSDVRAMAYIKQWLLNHGYEFNDKLNNPAHTLWIAMLDAYNRGIMDEKEHHKCDKDKK